MPFVMTTKATGDFQSPRPPEISVRYQQHCQVRIDAERKEEWTRAANVRRLNLSDFVRACADAGAATRLNQADLKQHFRALRRLLNAASSANDAGNASDVKAQITAASDLLRKLQGLA
jgi:hypothetical protein